MTLALFIALVIAVAALVVIEDWRVALPLLIAADLLRIGLMQQTIAPVSGTGTLLIVELITALSVGAIMLITALTFTKPYEPEQLDEFALFELRRSVRRAQQQRTQFGSRTTRYAVPIGAVILAGIATYVLGQAYPVARNSLLNSAWTFVLLCGLLMLVTANDVLKLGLGLLLLVGSAKLLYTGVTTRLNVLHWGLLELLTLLLALVAVYLSGLLYARLHTLEWSSLFDRR